MNPHVIGDVSGGQQLPTDVTGNLLLVADQVGAEAVPRGERRRAGLREENRVRSRLFDQRLPVATPVTGWLPCT